MEPCPVCGRACDGCGHSRARANLVALVESFGATIPPGFEPVGVSISVEVDKPVVWKVELVPVDDAEHP